MCYQKCFTDKATQHNGNTTAIAETVFSLTYTAVAACSALWRLANLAAVANTHRHTHTYASYCCVAMRLHWINLAHIIFEFLISMWTFFWFFLFLISRCCKSFDMQQMQLHHFDSHKRYQAAAAPAVAAGIYSCYVCMCVAGITGASGL